MSERNETFGWIHIGVIGAFLVAVLVIAFILFVGPREQVIVQGEDATLTEERAAQPAEALGRGPYRGLFVRDYAFDETAGTLAGTLANETDGLYEDVEVVFNLIGPGGEVVDSIAVERALLKPGEDWEFVVDVPADLDVDRVIAGDVDARMIDSERATETSEPSDLQAEESQIEDL